MQEIEPGTSIRLALTEAAAWCRMRPPVAEALESDDVVRRRRLVEDAGKLMSESYRRTGKIDKRANEMFREADLPSLIFMKDQLRSLILRPSIDLGELVSESEREE